MFCVKISATKAYTYGKNLLNGLFKGKSVTAGVQSTVEVGQKAVEQTALRVTKQAEKVAENKPLFCHEVLANCRGGRAYKTSVSMHGYLNGINHHLAKASPNPQQMNEPFFATGKTPREMINDTDCEFLFKIKPTEEKMTVYRGLPKRETWDSYYKRYQGLLNLKKGDKTYMPEYAYYTSDANYARTYLGDSEGIRIVMEIPQNARVSRIGKMGTCDEVVMPRFSRYECIEAPQKVVNGDESYYQVKLRYILPDESWRNISVNG